MAETRGAILILQAISPQITDSHTDYILNDLFDYYHIKPYHLITIFIGTGMVQNA